MARNESQDRLELRWKRVGFVLFAVAGITALTIGYSLQRRAHDALGIQIKAMEKQTDYAKAEVRMARDKLARLLRSEPILRQVAEMRLDLTKIVPTQRRIIPLLPRPPVSSPDAAEATLLQSPMTVRPLTGIATPGVRSSR